MSIKSVEDLNKVLEDLSLNKEWTEIDSVVKNDLVKSYHVDLADSLSHQSKKKVLGAPATKKSRRVKKDEDDGARSS